AQVRVAAAALVCGNPKLAPTGKAILDDAEVVRESGAAAEDVDLARAICAAATKNWAEFEVLGTKLLAAHPDSDQAFAIRSEALGRLGRYDEAEKVCRDRLQRNADDPIARRALVSTLLARENFAGVETVSLELVDKGKATQMDYNNLAWNGLFTKITEQTVD